MCLEDEWDFARNRRDEIVYDKLECGHEICHGCIRDYVLNCIWKGRNTCVFMKCPAFKCNYIIPPFLVSHILYTTTITTTTMTNDTRKKHIKAKAKAKAIQPIRNAAKDRAIASLERYQRFQLDEFVEQCDELYICPYRQCPFIICVDNSEFQVMDTLTLQEDEEENGDNDNNNDDDKENDNDDDDDDDKENDNNDDDDNNNNNNENEKKNRMEQTHKTKNQRKKKK
ncbi:ubiquitin specific protease [Reticulomyxa filosa]|uniref:Ubiquitin specific protease n=1 Tax=Reticulomyxa filosa TaxID=46433 RepID=X6ML66_RETFI|nr:ubiquitin specific protease [Reticulomyxa filosa]|eukprot:ETO14758.1 ubiquitin specific protease [Reticulomyxa filosa]